MPLCVSFKPTYIVQCAPMRFEHCYAEEDLTRQIGRVASATHPRTMDYTTLHRYRALLQLTGVFRSQAAGGPRR